MVQVVLNQAEIMRVLKVEFSRARRYNCSLTCLLIQVDRFQYLRDLYGMDITNSISESIVEIIHANTRLSDFVGKVGERFLLIMPHTDSKGAVITADRIREKLGSLDFDVSGKVIRVSLSIGLADNTGEESIFYDSILKRAETAVQKVISSGGDGTEILEVQE